MDHVSIATLRTFASALLDHLEETKGSEIAVPHDYFWWMSPEDAYALDARPRSEDLTVGQVSECIELLTSMVREDAPLNWGLVWLGQLLAAIGQQTGEI